MKSMLLATTVLAMAWPAAAAGPKQINTGGERGAYHSLFCPPLPGALAKAYFQGYRCATSAGTLENIQRGLENPNQVGFVQLDVFAREAAAKPDVGKKLAIIRQDIACEGIWMVTKNDRLQNYGDVLGYARRIEFLLPPEASGSSASFEYLQSIDQEGLGKARNKKYVADATTAIKAAAASQDGAVAFFVQFADPDNANIKLIKELGLHAIPVVSREITKAKVAGQDVYQVQQFSLTAGGLFSAGNTVTTACTPVAIVTGNPDALTDKGDAEDAKDLIKRVREVPSKELLPQEGRIAAIIAATKRIGGSALEEIYAAGDAARKKVEDLGR